MERRSGYSLQFEASHSRKTWRIATAEGEGGGSIELAEWGNHAYTVYVRVDI
jgi:hypothetical protein